MFTVAALYKFTRFEDPDALRPDLAELAGRNDVTGTLLLAREGINGTIAGPQSGIDEVLAHIRGLPGCSDIEIKFSKADRQPFNRMKVRLKREIVTMGQPDVDPTAVVGHYVEPKDWNALISAPDVAVIDTRNDYEVAIGSFEGAIDPKTDRFGDFPKWWEDNKSAFEGKTIAMFCTGGIRCEKSTNYLISKGVKDVFHLKGGILKYLEEIPEDQSTWHGECFVFDERVSVRHGLEQGDLSLCRGCRRPLHPEDLRRPEFELGVSCHHCIDATSETKKAGFRERQRQLVRDRQKTVEN